MSARHDEVYSERKARNRLEDQRRMAYRRAIEERAELRRIEQELGDDYSGRLSAIYLNVGLGALR
jgi:hypothetical protein